MRLQHLLLLAPTCVLLGCATPPNPPSHPTPIILWTGELPRKGAPAGAVDIPTTWSAGKPSTIPVRLGTRFGIRYAWRSEQEFDMPFTTVWRFPSPGVVDVQTGKVTREFRRTLSTSMCSGRRGLCQSVYSIDAADELIPGDWTVEILAEGVEPVRFTFTLVLAATP